MEFFKKRKNRSTKRRSQRSMTIESLETRTLMAAGPMFSHFYSAAAMRSVPADISVEKVEKASFDATLLRKNADANAKDSDPADVRTKSTAANIRLRPQTATMLKPKYDATFGRSEETFGRGRGPVTRLGHNTADAAFYAVADFFAKSVRRFGAICGVSL